MRRFLHSVLLLFFGVMPALSQSNLDVKGVGFFKDRSLEARLAFLSDFDPKSEAVLDAAFLEDSAFILLEQVKRKGYLRPRIEGRFLVGDALETAHWETVYSIELKADFRADHASFQIDPGTFYFYRSATVDGVALLHSEKLERFFIPGGFLLSGKASRVFTDANFERRVGRVVRALEDLGYRGARVESKEVSLDETSGAVNVSVVISEGPLYEVGVVEIWITREDRGEERTSDTQEGVPLTREWEREMHSRIRTEAYRAGYPDVRLKSEVTGEVVVGDSLLRQNLRFHVDYGERVTLLGVDFTGDSKTRRSVLKRESRLERENPLDRIEVNAAQRRLMGLGIYQDVTLDFEPAEGERRSVVFDLTPNLWKELQMRFGWGSYEQARVGFRWEHKNPFGRAHRYEVDVKQSLKATGAEASYLIPQIAGSDLTAYLSGNYSLREELSFDRTTTGFAVGTSKQFADSGLRLSVEYGLAKEKAERRRASLFVSEEKATVGGLKLRASLDRRDDFMAPSAGYNLFASLKVASQLMGGSVDFQKVELGGTYHRAINRSLLLHAGLRGGTILAGGGSRQIPFNERFFLGGENSVRGYREGGATPVDANGIEIGAETFTLLNLELEQRISRQFSAVLFYDGILNWESARIADEGVRSFLSSAGLGLRYNTPVGPIRLEYGHNLNRRRSDPRGALHLSIGFPF